MAGTLPDDKGRFNCPECGRSVARERGLLRTRRHWRPALIGAVLVLMGSGLGGTVLLHETNAWRFAPAFMVIDAIPRMLRFGKLDEEFSRRKFLEGYQPIRFVFDDAFSPDRYQQLSDAHPLGV